MARLLALVLFTGCSATTYAFTPASNKPLSPKPENCAIEVMTSPPSGNYEEVGILEFYNGPEPKTVEAVKAAVAKQACGAGGDAVIATATDKGIFTKGSVIKYTREIAAPVPSAKPVAPAAPVPPAKP